MLYQTLDTVPRGIQRTQSQYKQTLEKCLGQSCSKADNFNPGFSLIFCLIVFSWIIFLLLFRAPIIKLLTKRFNLNLLLKLSYLNSNLALTLGYLNPFLNNHALYFVFSTHFSISGYQMKPCISFWSTTSKTH